MQCSLYSPQSSSVCTPPSTSHNCHTRSISASPGHNNCTAGGCQELHSIGLHWSSLHCSSLQWNLLNFTAIHCTSTDYTVLHCTLAPCSAGQYRLEWLVITCWCFFDSCYSPLSPLVCLFVWQLLFTTISSCLFVSLTAVIHHYLLLFVCLFDSCYSPLSPLVCLFVCLTAVIHHYLPLFVCLFNSCYSPLSPLQHHCNSVLLESKIHLGLTNINTPTAVHVTWVFIWHSALCCQCVGETNPLSLVTKNVQVRLNS